MIVVDEEVASIIKEASLYRAVDALPREGGITAIEGSKYERVLIKIQNLVFKKKKIQIDINTNNMYYLQCFSLICQFLDTFYNHNSHSEFKK